MSLAITRIKSWNSNKVSKKNQINGKMRKEAYHTFPRSTSKRDILLKAIPKPTVHPIYPTPSVEAIESSRLLFHCLKTTRPELLVGHEEMHEDLRSHLIESTDREAQPDIEEILRWNYVKGHDLVTWTDDLLRAKQQFEHIDDEFYKPTPTASRHRIAGMWQVLFEEGAIFHVKCEEHFEDAGFYYGFHEDVTSPQLSTNQLTETCQKNMENLAHTLKPESDNDVMTRLTPYWIEELDLADALSYLQKNSQDALFRKALQRAPKERSRAELTLIYEEIIHIKPIVHLSDSVKRELAGVVQYEFHHEPGTFVFKQGDEGTSWYIILHGSVDVDIFGKGMVCTLKEGDDFGNLALVNDAPRSASIIVAEPNCHFLKVGKIDFNRILKDVEANTVRLKEHGRDVLILEKIRSPTRKLSGKYHTLFEQDPDLGEKSYRYSVTAGTPEAIVEHILEYIRPWKGNCYDETLVEFILMHQIFMDAKTLLDLLLKNYRSEDALSASFEKSMKRKIVYFIVRWSRIMTYAQEDQRVVEKFVQKLEDEIDFDSSENPDFKQLKTELGRMYNWNSRTEDCTPRDTYMVIEDSVKRYRTGGGEIDLQRPIQDGDEVLLKIHSCDKVYTTVKVPISSSVDDILNAVAEKTNANRESIQLSEVQENGDSIVISVDQKSVATSMNLNSTLTVCEHNNNRSYLCIIKPPSFFHEPHFDLVNLQELAYYVTQYDWHLVNNVHVMEYVYKVFGKKKFKKPTPNLDILGRRFNQLAYWPPTAICTCTNSNKRALMLRKFIKLAQHLKVYQNMFAFMAVTIGLVNHAVSRLTTTWDKLPTKYQKLMQDFESILDPSRNHRNYRLLTSSMEPPFIPHLPLLLKDMTFQHEGNDSHKQDLVNFEKMRMIGSSINSIMLGCSETIEKSAVISSSKSTEQTKAFAKSIKVITDQKRLNALSAQLEPKR